MSLLFPTLAPILPPYHKSIPYHIIPVDTSDITTCQSRFKTIQRRKQTSSFFFCLRLTSNQSLQEVNPDKDTIVKKTTPILYIFFFIISISFKYYSYQTIRMLLAKRKNMTEQKDIQYLFPLSP